MPVAIAFSSNLLLQIKDVLSRLDINGAAWEIDMSRVSTLRRAVPGAAEKLARWKSMILLIYTGPGSSSCLRAF